MRSRPFVALFLAVFVATMGISMVSPLLPVYAKELGASGVWLGLTFSVFALVQTIVGPFAGQLSDRFGRKPFIVAGLLVYLIAALGYLTADSFYQVIAFRAFSGVGTSLIFSVAYAYVGDMTPPGQEGRWLGVFAAADILGFGTGPLIAGILRETTGFSSVFVAMAALLALAAVIVVVWLPGLSPAERVQRIAATGHAARPAAKAWPMRRAILEPLVLAVTVHVALRSLSTGATFSLLALRLEDGLGASPVLIGVAFATQDLTGGLAQPLWGRLVDRRDRRLLVALGLGGSAVVLGLIGLVPSYALAVAALLALGATTALAQVAASALQVVAGRRVGMGTVLGLGSAGNGIGILTGSIAGGLLYELVGLGAAFLFGGIVLAVGVPVFLLLSRGATGEEAPALPAEPEATASAAR